MAEIPADTSWVPKPGTVVAERYRVDAVIGEGGMGAVVSAIHLGLGERVAVKFLHPRLTTDKDAIERFIREARATSRIKCEHVVRMLDVGSTNEGLPYIAMEFLPGEDLSERLKVSGPFPIELAVDCILQAAEALAEAHAAGIVHRDVKPSNLVLSKRTDGTPLLKVLDFGISKLEPIDERDKRLTETQAVFGSPTYMSPEQVRSAKRVDGQTDVWALGVVLYEILTGRLPFEGETVPAVLASVAADPPTPITTVRRDVPTEIESAVLHCLEKDPTRRATLADLCHRLRPFATTAGQRSADHIARVVPRSIEPPPPLLTPPPPPPLITGPPVATVSSNPRAAFGVTEPDVLPPTFTRTDGSTPGMWLWRTVVAAFVTASVVLIVAFVVMRQRAAAATPPSTIHDPSPAASTTTTVASSALPVTIAPSESATPPPPASPSTSLSSPESPPKSIRPVVLTTKHRPTASSSSPPTPTPPPPTTIGVAPPATTAHAAPAQTSDDRR